MKWSRERDYHGYKSYSEDAAGEDGIAARFVAALKSLVKPTPSSRIGDRNRQGYSTLGGAGGSKQPADIPFPTAPANVTPARRP